MKIMVLNDGETFTSINGCKIVDVPDDFSTDDIEDSLKAIKDGINDINVHVVAELGEHGEWKW